MAANIQANTFDSTFGQTELRFRRRKVECTAVTRFPSTSLVESTRTAAQFSRTYVLLPESNATSFNQSMIDYLRKEWPLAVFIVGTVIGTLLALLYI